MEILYFIQVIQYLLLITRSSEIFHKKEMVGGSPKAVAAAAAQSKAPSDSPGGFKARMAVKKDSLKKGLKNFGKNVVSKEDRDNIKNKLKGLSGTQTSGERLKSASAAVAMFKVIKFMVYLFSLFLLPLMPFYAATKALFKKGIPLAKEVVIPESVDYDKKLREKEQLEESKQK